MKAKDIDRQALRFEVNLRLVECPQDFDKTVELWVTLLVPPSAWNRRKAVSNISFGQLNRELWKRGHLAG